MKFSSNNVGLKSCNISCLDLYRIVVLCSVVYICILSDSYIRPNVTSVKIILLNEQ